MSPCSRNALRRFFFRTSIVSARNARAWLSLLPSMIVTKQLHLDIYFDDGPAAQNLAERLGAIRLPAMGGSCPVYADPAGHPFCLSRPGQ